MFGRLTSNQEPTSLPVSLHATLSADYAADSSRLTVPRVGLGIIADVMQHVDPGASNFEQRLAAVIAMLESPVSSSTASSGVGSDAPAVSDGEEKRDKEREDKDKDKKDRKEKKEKIDKLDKLEKEKKKHK